jgi:endonuclease-3 related protein
MGKTALRQLHDRLLEEYGPQGWWPLCAHLGTNPTKTGSIRGYHPGDYSFPRTDNERFEICVGAILTQNTAWTNVEKALLALHEKGCLDAKKLATLPLPSLKKAIRPAGYYNQKAKKLKIFTAFYTALAGRTPTRDELLSLWGVGPETADSILLYAYGVPVFVIDAYTRRVLASEKLATKEATYDALQELFHTTLPSSQEGAVALYQEYHALIVEHAKRLPRK